MLALSASLVTALIVGILLSQQEDLQVFAAFSAAKLYVLPATYFYFLLAIVWPRIGYPSISLPLWWTSLAAAITLSLVGAIAVPRQEIGMVAMAQGFGLSAGMLLVSLTGLLANRWSEHQQNQYVALVVSAALVSAVLGITLGPYVALTTPVALGLLYVGRRRQRWRFASILGAVFLLWRMFPTLVSPASSIADRTQFAIGAALLLLLMLPRRLRIPIAILSVVSVAAVFAASDLPRLLVGIVPDGIDEVTFAHRAYEAAAVLELAAQDSTTFLFGLGPSATVDLSRSPDYLTLISSGRDIFAVDDVHFLTSWLILKFGVLGIVWLVIFGIAAARSISSLIRQNNPPAFLVFAALFVLTGIAAALPAATNIFSNPMLALSMGLLTSTVLQRKNELMQHRTTGSKP